MADPAYLHVNSPARQSFVITPGSSDLAYPIRQLYVGTGGTVVGFLQGDDTGGTAIAFKNIPDGAVLSYAFKRIVTTNGTDTTTATNLVGVY